MGELSVGRPIKIDGMAYAPTNEQGVVFLFGRLASKLGFHVEYVQNRFPDCWARRRGKVYRIEFEHRASNYKGHPPHGADIIVCWENDWENRLKQYQHLEIISLKKYVGAPFRVFAVGASVDSWGKFLDTHSKVGWPVPNRAEVGDLVIMYRRKPASEIRDLWKVVGPFYEIKKGGLGAYMRLMIRLRKPIAFDSLRKDPTTRNLGVVRKQFQGKTDITSDWPLFFTKIIDGNPKAKSALHDYHAD